MTTQHLGVIGMYAYCVVIKSYKSISSMAFTKEEIKSIEAQIQDFDANSSKVIADHNSETTIPKVGWDCKKCKSKLSVQNDRGKYVDAVIADCPLCSEQKKIVTLNVYTN